MKNWKPFQWQKGQGSAVSTVTRLQDDQPTVLLFPAEAQLFSTRNHPDQL